MTTTNQSWIYFLLISLLKFHFKNVMKISHCVPCLNEDEALESTTKCTREFFINCFIFHGFILEEFSLFKKYKNVRTRGKLVIIQGSSSFANVD